MPRGRGIREHARAKGARLFPEDRLDERATDDLFAAIARDELRARVEEPDVAVAIETDDEIVRELDRGRVAPLRDGERRGERLTLERELAFDARDVRIAIGLEHDGELDVDRFVQRGFRRGSVRG